MLQLITQLVENVQAQKTVKPVKIVSTVNTVLKMEVAVGLQLIFESFRVIFISNKLAAL